VPGSAVAAVGASRATTTCDGLPPLTDIPQTGGATHLAADLDGDGIFQFVGLVPPELSTTHTWLLVTTAGTSSGMLSTPITDLGSGRPLRLVRAADVDGDGDQEVAIRSPMGASTEMDQVWGLRGCAWVPVTTGDETTPTGFLLGASAMHTDGFSCTYGERNQLHRYRTSRNPETLQHQVSTQTFDWSDLHLTPAGPETTRVVPDKALDAMTSAGFDCDRALPKGDARTAAASTPTTSTPSPAARPAAAAPVRAQPRFTG
jgi:hypothetical protein